MSAITETQKLQASPSKSKDSSSLEIQHDI